SSSIWPRNCRHQAARPSTLASTASWVIKPSKATPINQRSICAATSCTSRGARPLTLSAGTSPTWNTHRPPTQKTWASCQRIPSRDGARWCRSEVLDFDNLVLDRAAWRLDDDDVTFFLADDGAGDRRTV